MRVALVHYWLVGMRGGEKVLEALCRMYPDAHIYTHCVAPEALSDLLRQKSIRTTFIQRLPYSQRWYKQYLPLMPLALEQLDLRDYDLVISSESGPAKGVITRADTAHICYCHTPMRYLWDFYQDYLENAGFVTRLFMRPLFHYLRAWDVLSAGRADTIVANSHTVARRVGRWWGRKAVVVHPPVDVERFAPAQGLPLAGDNSSRPYVCCGQLVRYKRVDVAVRACAASGRHLIVAGDGEERQRLEALAKTLEGGSCVSFVGRVTDAEMTALYARCRALLFPGEEDFGIVPLEVMASGRPVIAYGRGGALETVVDGKTGLFFFEQTTSSLVEALERFEAQEACFDPQYLIAHAAHFDQAHFQAAFQAQVEATFSQLGLSFPTSHQPSPTISNPLLRYS